VSRSGWSRVPAVFVTTTRTPIRCLKSWLPGRVARRCASAMLARSSATGKASGAFLSLPTVNVAVCPAVTGRFAAARDRRATGAGIHRQCRCCARHRPAVFVTTTANVMPLSEVVVAGSCSSLLSPR